VQQHSVRLPVFNNFLLPNVPFYRLWDWEDSPCDTLGSVGTKEVETENTSGLKIFPNPITNELNISGLGLNASVTIADVGGKVVLQKTEIDASGGAYTLDLSAIPSGFYFVVVRQGQTVQQKKIVKF